MKLKTRVVVVALSLLVPLAASAIGTGAQTAEATWTGKLSDSMCGADHKANGGTMAKDRACTLDCVKGHGSEYIFVNTADKKIYKIGNQKVPALETHAGHTVEVTGTMKGDTITVSKIVMPAGKK